ncbi:MAG: hypothetical protein ACRDOK_13070 [Streptosporangiaceae bacterium]
MILGVDQVANPKPAPDLYRTACASLAAAPASAPASAVALEDPRRASPRPGLPACTSSVSVAARCRPRG